jgi:hypothetical protein
VAQTAVGADLREALDRLLALAAEITLDLKVSVDVVAELRDLRVSEVAYLLVGREPRRVADLECLRAADPEDVGQPDLESLVARKVDACDSCH